MNELTKLDKVVELLLSQNERKVGYSMLHHLESEEVVAVLSLCGKMPADHRNIIGRSMFTANMNARGDTFWDKSALRIALVKGQLFRNHPPGMPKRQAQADNSFDECKLYGIDIL